MTKKPTQPEVVTSAGMTVEVPIDGTDRKYTLRVPTYGDAGAIAARAVTTLAPNDAIFADRLRAALRASDLPEEEKTRFLEGIDAAEDATDALDALFFAHGTERKDWPEDVRKEVAAAQRDVLAAMRVRQRAEWAMQGDPGLAQLRMHRIEAGRMEQTAVVALCLGIAEGDVAALPALDVTVLYARAAGLMRPTPSAEKN